MSMHKLKESIRDGLDKFVPSTQRGVARAIHGLTSIARNEDGIVTIALDEENAEIDVGNETTMEHEVFDLADEAAAIQRFFEMVNEWESQEESTMKESKDEQVVDLMGATKATLNNMVKFYNFAQDEAKKTMIDAKDLWKYLIKKVKTEAKISDFALVKAGMPIPMVMEVLGEADPKTLAYKTLILTMDDGSTKSIPLDEVLPKIAPYAKQFKTPIEALVMGNPEGILKVMQKVFGKNVTQWSIPATEAAINMDFLSALVLSEMYNLAKFGKESALVEMIKVEGKTTMQLKSEAVEKISDAFDKSDKQYVVNLFPNVLPDYPMQLVQEAQTVLNTLSADEMDKLWPNINREYLVNLKEDELQELADRMTENCGMDHTQKKKKKAKKKVEAASNPPAGRGGRGSCGGTRRQDGSGAGRGNMGTPNQPAKKNRRTSFGAPAQAGATLRGVGRRGRSA